LPTDFLHGFSEKATLLTGKHKDRRQITDKRFNH
jgi:hypothetical protein